MTTGPHGLMVRTVRRGRVGAIAMLLAATGLARAQQPAFSDQTAAAGVACRQELVSGFPGDNRFMVGGGAVGDFNRDGWPDLFMLAGGVEPDRLFINNRDGTFTDRAGEFGLAQRHRGAGAAVGDYNRDGWPDLYVTSYGDSGVFPGPGKHRLYRNNAGASFTDVAAAAGVNLVSPTTDGFGAAFGDYDLDGDLDLFVCSWFNDQDANLLFRNDGPVGPAGEHRFTNVTDAAGLDTDLIRGFAPRFVDMTGDRYPELLITADFGSQRYYVNNADGTFTNATAAAGVTHDCNAMGSAVADFDGDTRPDWFITNIYFDPQTTNRPCGNSLYLNRHPAPFVQASEPAGVIDGAWGWGAVAIDFDHDTRTDIVHTNGWFQFTNRPMRAFRNLGVAGSTPVFQDVAPDAGIAHTDQGRGLAHLDYDRDGDQDVVLFVNNGDMKLFRNDLAGPNTHWLRVRLDTSASPCVAPDGVGAKVSVTINGQVQARWASPGCNFISQSESALHFGLGAADRVDELLVEWPDGTVSRLTDVPADTGVVVAARAPADINADASLDAFDVNAFVDAFNAGDMDLADLDRDGSLTASDFAAYLSALAAGGCAP